MDYVYIILKNGRVLAAFPSRSDAEFFLSSVKGSPLYKIEECPFYEIDFS